MDFIELKRIGGYMMTSNVIKSKQRACIYSENNIIYNVNEEFLQLTGYKASAFVGKSFDDLGILLKSTAQIGIEKIKEVSNLYIFNNEDQPIDIMVTWEELNDQNQKVYYVEENLKSSLGWMIYNFENTDINNKDAIAIYSYPECILLKTNKKYSETLDLMGLKTDNIVGEITPLPESFLSHIKKGDSYHKQEVELPAQDGKSTYWNMEIRPIFGYDGKRYLITSFYNVTRKVLARNILEKQRVEMEIILDNISDSIIRMNNKGRFTYVNKAARDKLAYYNPDVTSIDHRQMHTFFKRSDINGNEISFEQSPEMRVLRGEKLTNYVTIGTSELPTTYHKCNGTPIYDEHGNIDGGLLIFNDIEDVFKIEEYNALKDNVKDIFLSYASLSYDDLKIKYINEAGFNTLKKYDPHIASIGEIIGKNFFEIYTSKKENLIKDIKKSVKGKVIHSHKKKFIESGKEKYIKTIFQPIFDKNDKVEKIIAVGIDITDEELANQQMTKALEIQEEIFINTSHELKTPLNLISSASQLLNMQLEGELEENTKNKILKSNKIIMQNCYRLIKLTNNILDISKMETGFYELNLSDHKIVEVIETIVSSVSQYTNASGQQIIFDTDIEDITMAVDLYKFERVLLNLISNAIKFSNSNGLITVKLAKKDNTLKISIEDDGIGIDKEDLHTVFNKFVQLNTSLNRLSEGSGIGLALVKSIVELHGGSIRVESDLGKGSKFTVKLPIITVGNITSDQNEFFNIDQIENIKMELSDIYS